MSICIKPTKGQNSSDSELVENEIAWREFSSPQLTTAIHRFALEVLKGALYGADDDSNIDGVRWYLDLNTMTASHLAGDYELAQVDVLQLIEIEIAQREDINIGAFCGYHDESETYLAIANRFRSWAKRLESAAVRQEIGLANWRSDHGKLSDS